jgi:hypothetical protein
MPERVEMRLGATVHCTELVTGNGLSGQFTYSREAGLKTKLFSFDEFFYIDTDEPVYLLTEELETISLFGSFGGPGTRSSVHSERALHTDTIHSNIGVAGPDKWRLDDKIKRITFSVPEAFGILRNNTKIAQLRKPHRQRGRNDWALLNFSANGRHIRLFYQAKYKWDGDEPVEVTPYFEVEFDDSVLINDYSLPIQDILSFLSFSLGVGISPFDISISRISYEELAQQLEQKAFTEGHNILSFWRKDDAEIESDSFHGSPIQSYDSRELVSLERCLKGWIARVDEWRESNQLMVQCFKRRKEISAERLMLATRWLETIPSTKAQELLTQEQIGAMVNAAHEVTLAFPGVISRERLSGALRVVKCESRKQQMERLVDLVSTTFELPLPKNEFLELLNSALGLRGKAAHGSLPLSSQQSFLDCNRATVAVETLACMLMAMDLPLSEDGKERLKSHRAIGYLRHML